MHSEGMTRPTDPLDAALSRLHATDPEFRRGLTNHGPMAAEALEALGHPECIEGFVDGYLPRLEAMGAVEPLAGDWRDALGQPGARARLIATFDRRLRNEEPAAVLADTLPVLAPGFVAAAFHGPLRVAHGVRAWNRRASDPRRRELAHGLGYWASRYQELPGTVGVRAQAGLGPLDALTGVPQVDEASRRGGLIFDRFGALDDLPGFEAAVEAFDPAALSPTDALDELAAACARMYLAATSGRNRFVFLHGITGTAAVRTLLPLAPALQPTLVGHLFHALAGVYATHGEPNDALTRVWPQPLREDGDLSLHAQRAAVSPDDHTIKLVEASLGEFRRSGRPEFLAVVEHRLGASSS
jgi:hypothetical protein